MVCDKTPEVYVAEVFEIELQVSNGLMELSQRSIVPVWLPKVNKPLVSPEQIVVPPVTEPPTDVAFTVIVT